MEFLFFSISVSMSFTLGYIELPRPVYLAGNASNGRIWTPDSTGGVLTLNMGSRNTIRGIGANAANELYKIEHVSGDRQTGETVRVIFSGREQVFKGVKKIVASGDAGADHIYVGEGVTSDIEFHGGEGNDVLIYSGSGSVFAYGDGGDDYFVAESAAKGAVMEGGTGQDYLVYNGRGSANISGGQGNDQIYGGPGNDQLGGRTTAMTFTEWVAPTSSAAGTATTSSTWP